LAGGAQATAPSILGRADALPLVGLGKQNERKKKMKKNEK
jgi:hypothetical protein